VQKSKEKKEKQINVVNLKKKKWKFDFRSKGDYILFIWVIVVAVIIGASITAFDIPWIVGVYSGLGLYVSVVLFFWVKRNKEIWKENP